MPDVCSTKFGYPGKEYINWEEEIFQAQQQPMNGTIETSVFCQAVGWKGYSLFSGCDMRVRCDRCIFPVFIEQRRGEAPGNHPCNPYIKKRAEELGYDDMWNLKLIQIILKELLDFIKNK